MANRYRSGTISVEVDVADCIDEFDTDVLIAELKDRARDGDDGARDFIGVVTPLKPSEFVVKQMQSILDDLRLKRFDLAAAGLETLIADLTAPNTIPTRADYDRAMVETRKARDAQAVSQ